MLVESKLCSHVRRESSFRVPPSLVLKQCYHGVNLYSNLARFSSSDHRSGIQIRYYAYLLKNIKHSESLFSAYHHKKVQQFGKLTPFKYTVL